MTTTTEPEGGPMTDTATDRDEPGELDTEQFARLAAGVVRHAGRPMSRDEIHAALDLLAADYSDTMTAAATWEAWNRGWIEFGVSDGEITVWPGTTPPEDR
jgi:hypothetical protein